MHTFIANHRDELIERCKFKVAQRPPPVGGEPGLTSGIPLFLDQLARTLAAENGGNMVESLRISGPSGGDAQSHSEMGISATAQGHDLLKRGYSVDQVVHHYGDVCQAITDLAFERDEPFENSDFRTLNRCLDTAIADAVTEFGFQRESNLARQRDAEQNQRAGMLIHELRNALATASASLRAIELSGMPVTGATGSVLKRSLTAMGNLVSSALDDVRAGTTDPRETFSVMSFIADAQRVAQLQADVVGSPLTVPPVDPSLYLRADRELLLAALVNLLQNAFKFTHARTEVTLKAHAFGDSVLIEVQDHCGGLPGGSVQRMFTPFTQGAVDRSGLGLGLSIARQQVEADGGTLGVRDVPGTGCVFTITLPRKRAAEVAI